MFCLLCYILLYKIGKLKRMFFRSKFHFLFFKALIQMKVGKIIYEKLDKFPKIIIELKKKLNQERKLYQLQRTLLLFTLYFMLFILMSIKYKKITIIIITKKKISAVEGITILSYTFVLI